jgi:hypothetical protein
VHARDKSAADTAAPAAAATGRGRKRKRKQGEADEQQQQQQQATKKKGKDEEFGVTRGIDFKGVRSVINYDIPDSLQVGTLGNGGGGGCETVAFMVQGVCVWGGGGQGRSLFERAQNAAGFTTWCNEIQSTGCSVLQGAFGLHCDVMVLCCCVLYTAMQLYAACQLLLS